MADDVGIVGSPSTTAKITVDILEDATNAPLHGDLVYLTHPLNDRCLIAIGTVTDITTMNRWHEDPNMRGVLKRHGSLPHLSGVGDVRTAEVLVQAAYLADNADPAQGEAPIEAAAALTMSPTTGAAVARVTDPFLDQLLRRHHNEITYLGHIYRTEVRLPLTLRHFGRGDGGAGEAYHSGIFGVTGSGKSAFAAYLLAGQMRHRNLGVLVIDPQGQFTSEIGLPFPLQEWAERLGRQVRTYSISQNLRLRQDAPLLADLLGLTRFFRDLLTIRAEDPRDSAVAELTRILRGIANWDDLPAEQVLRQMVTALAGDAQALQRIYVSPGPRARLTTVLNTLLTDQATFDMTLEVFAPIHSLFTARSLSGRARTSIWQVLQEAVSPGDAARPFVVLDFSSENVAEGLLESTAVKARILRVVCTDLNVIAEKAYRGRDSLNVLVVFDEAQRFAAEEPEEEQAQLLSDRLVDYVRTTRKYGLGWMFITQETGSLRRGIYNQLRVRAFGYGLTSGTELNRLRETIGDPAALELYRSFVDPAAITPAQYPFMLTGPVSPLSFTGAPVFLSVYTDFDRFLNDNRFLREGLAEPRH
ncbi:MAG: helicase HerA domain-containing protein [Candidatus Limnocylindria bacterium]